MEIVDGSESSDTQTLNDSSNKGTKELSKPIQSTVSSHEEPNSPESDKTEISLDQVEPTESLEIIEVTSREEDNLARNLDDFESNDGTNKSFVCEKCPKTYEDQLTLEEHIFAHHRNQPNSPGVDSPEQNQINLAQNQTKEMSACTLCEKMYESKEGLEEHIKTEHEADEGSVCTICKKCYESKGNLEEHMKQEHESNELSSVHLHYL